MSNLGFSSSVCKEVALGVGKLSLHCDTGTIQKIVSYGVIPTDADVRDVCMPTAYTKKCDPFFNHVTVEEEIHTKCLNKKACTIDIKDDLLNLTNSAPECLKRTAVFYGQVLCFQDEKRLEQKVYYGSVLCYVCIANALIYWLAIEYMSRKA